VEIDRGSFLISIPVAADGVGFPPPLTVFTKS